LNDVLEAAHTARIPAARASDADRAAWLRAIADALEAHSDTLVAIAAEETHLPEPRLRGEVTRTTFQARLFADRVESGDLLEVRIDAADPDWPMGPRPDLRRGFVPIGPVLVFAASNFPFAFSVVGGDTVSALAVGCPVVVKTHDAHPRLARATAEIVAAALTTAGAPVGLFGTIHDREDGVRAIQDVRIRAAGFTGSEAGGRALHDLAASRPDPIPFYGELGSTNPVVVTPAGWSERADDIVDGFTASFTMGCGQFCTKPGAVLVPDLDAFAARITLPQVHPMLDERIGCGFEQTLQQVGAHSAVKVLRTGPGTSDSPAATVLGVDADAVLADPAIVTTEMFGPAAVLVGYRDIAQAVGVLAVIRGALTATIQGTVAVDPDAPRLIEAMSHLAGRVIYNQWPTGVTVSDAQQHGGPWPATTAPTTTSVGTAAAQRFARPVAFQNVPETILPPGLGR
jgi:NADP-dependent aldehyde dehydrogenase